MKPVYIAKLFLLSSLVIPGTAKAKSLGVVSGRISHSNKAALASYCERKKEYFELTGKAFSLDELKGSQSLSTVEVHFSLGRSRSREDATELSIMAAKADFTYKNSSFLHKHMSGSFASQLMHDFEEKLQASVKLNPSASSHLVSLGHFPIVCDLLNEDVEIALRLRIYSSSQQAVVELTENQVDRVSESMLSKEKLWINPSSSCQDKKISLAALLAKSLEDEAHYDFYANGSNRKFLQALKAATAGGCQLRQNPEHLAEAMRSVFSRRMSTNAAVNIKITIEGLENE